MGFPLFRLPQLALLEVFQNYDLFEVFTISKTSTRAKHVVQSMKRKVHLVELILHNFLKLRVMENNNLTDYSFKIVRNSDRPVAKLEGNNITLNVGRPLEGTLDLFEHFQETFSLSLHYLSIDTACFDSTQLHLLTLAAKFPFPNMNLEVERLEKLDQVLRVLARPLQTLTFSISFSNSERPISHIPIQSVQCETLNIFSRHLIQLKLIMIFDFVTAEFLRIEMPSGDLNVFLKSWKQGKTHQRMKRLEIQYLSYLNLAIAFEELEPTSDDPDVLYSDFGEIAIKGINGKIARVEFERHREYTFFEITVDH